MPCAAPSSPARRRPRVRGAILVIVDQVAPPQAPCPWPSPATLAATSPVGGDRRYRDPRGRCDVTAVPARRLPATTGAAGRPTPGSPAGAVPTPAAWPSVPTALALHPAPGRARAGHHAAGRAGPGEESERRGPARPDRAVLVRRQPVRHLSPGRGQTTRPGADRCLAPSPHPGGHRRPIGCGDTRKGFADLTNPGWTRPRGGRSTRRASVSRCGRVRSDGRALGADRRVRRLSVAGPRSGARSRTPRRSRARRSSSRCRRRRSAGPWSSGRGCTRTPRSRGRR